MNCPNCNVPLRIAERQSVEIDYCPDCRGVWLDRGELDKILERSSQPEGGMGLDVRRDRGNREHDRPHAGALRKKRRDWLGDLFDF